MSTPAPDSASEPPQARSRQRLTNLGWCLLALAGPLALYAQFDWIATVRWHGVRIAFDEFDMSAYHHTSRWTAGEGTLYEDIPSEYPLAANLLFAAVRMIADHLAPVPPGLHGYAQVWMSLAWVVHVGTLRRLAQEFSWPVLLLWANPVVIYFALLRFDLYPTVLTLLALFAARSDRHRGAALWFGLALAVKGYALFCLPAFVVFVWRRAGWRHAAAACAISVAPFAASNAVVWSYAGFDGMAAPYRFHAARGLDSSSSTYDALADGFGWAGAKRIEEYPRLASALQIGAALAAAGLLALRRREDQFAGFVDAGTVALVALLSLSLFYSPQFVLWVIPFVIVSGSGVRSVVLGAYLIVSWCYFPFAFDLRHTSDYEKRWADFFLTSVVALTAARLALGALALVRLVRPTRKPHSTV